MYGLPQFVLTYSIFALFAGIGLTTIPALWTRESAATWDGAQKIAVTVVVAIVVSISTFGASIAFQWSTGYRR